MEEKNDLEVLVGTYANDGGKGVYRVKINPQTGEINAQELLAEIENPSFLAISSDQKQLYAVQENEVGSVSSYAWNADRSKLIETSSAKTNGQNPCYVALDESEKLLAVGNYSSGNFSCYCVEDNKIAECSTQIIQHADRTGSSETQSRPHVHCVKFHKNGLLYAVDLGVDQVLSYKISNYQLEEKRVALTTNSGIGPRHLVFHTCKPIVYLTTEFKNAILVAEIDDKTGDFTVVQEISMLPKKVTEESFAADLHLSDDGQFLYATNRGHNSIVTYSVNSEGRLALINHLSTGGAFPRSFTLCANNRFVVVANQKSHSVVVLERNKRLGTLKHTGHQTKIPSPVFVMFLGWSHQ